MPKLCHDHCFLKELQPALSCATFTERLESNLDFRSITHFPHTALNASKLSWSNVALCPRDWMTGFKSYVMSLCCVRVGYKAFYLAASCMCCTECVYECECVCVCHCVCLCVSLCACVCVCACVLLDWALTDVSYSKWLDLFVQVLYLVGWFTIPFHFLVNIFRLILCKTEYY